MSGSDPGDLPLAGRGDVTVQGHWLLARLGKRVLRPGGIRLTRALLRHANLTNADVVELAPGLGRTATEIITRRPRSYTGVDRDPEAVRSVNEIVAGLGAVRVGDAANTGLPDASADVVIGEAMLTMQGDRTKDHILTEVVRLLRPGGRYAIHELALIPDTLGDDVKTDVRQALARTMKINARPLTCAEWQHLLTDHGLVVDHVETAPMALLQPRRLVADEGRRGALRFARNLLVLPDARRRVLAMRRTFRQYREHLVAVAVIAHKHDDSQSGGADPHGAGQAANSLATPRASGSGHCARSGPVRTKGPTSRPFGAGAQWLHNIEAGGPVEVTVGRRTFPVEHRRLELDEALRVFTDYERRNRAAGRILRRVLSWLLGWRYDGSPNARVRMAEQLPLITFRPTTS